MKVSISILTGLLVIVALAVAVLVFLINSRSGQSGVDSFEECIEAGGALAESYPVQCRINGRSFTDPSQRLQQP